MYIQQFKYGQISFFGSQGPQTLCYTYYGLIKICIKEELYTKSRLTIVRICQSALLNAGVIFIPTHNSSILGVNKMTATEMQLCLPNNNSTLLFNTLKFVKSDIFLKIAFLNFRIKTINVDKTNLNTNMYKNFLNYLRLILTPIMDTLTKYVCISYSNIFNYNYFRNANIYSNDNIKYGYGCL